MPAERTRGSRRTDADGSQLVWTMPVEPVDSSGIAFTTAMTPITFSSSPSATADSMSPPAYPDSTFDDMPPLVDAPPLSSEFILFPPLDESNPAAAARKQAHSKKKPENHIPRPPNAFILFRSSFIKSQHVSTEVETNHSTLSKIIGLTWQNLPEDERKVWHAKAKNALEEHKRKYPKYAFRPLHNRARTATTAGTCGPGGGLEGKRKVREVEPKDMKRCAKIAELLISGKKGADLEAAIQEFDKTHVPEIITRFEAPITAYQYRKSSGGSQETEGAQLTLKDGRPAAKKRRVASAKSSRSSTPDTVPSTPVVESVPHHFQETGPVFDFTSFAFDSETSTDFNCGSYAASSPSTNSVPNTPPLHINTSFAHDTSLPWSSPQVYSAASPASSISEIHTPGLEFASFDDALYNKYPSTPSDDVFSSVFAQQQSVDFTGNTGITPGMEFVPDMGLPVGAAGLVGHNTDHHHHHHHSHIDPYLSLSHSSPEYHQFDQMAAVLGSMPCAPTTTSSSSTSSTTGLYDVVSPSPSCHSLDLDFSLFMQPGMPQSAF